MAIEAEVATEVAAVKSAVVIVDEALTHHVASEADTEVVEELHSLQLVEENTILITEPERSV